MADLQNRDSSHYKSLIIIPSQCALKALIVNDMIIDIFSMYKTVQTSADTLSTQLHTIV